MHLCSTSWVKTAATLLPLCQRPTRCMAGAIKASCLPVQHPSTEQQPGNSMLGTLTMKEAVKCIPCHRCLQFCHNPVKMLPPLQSNPRHTVPFCWTGLLLRSACAGKSQQALRFKFESAAARAKWQRADKSNKAPAVGYGPTTAHAVALAALAAVMYNAVLCYAVPVRSWAAVSV